MKIARMISPKVTRFFGLGTSTGSWYEAILDIGSRMQSLAEVVRLGDVCYQRSRWPTRRQMIERVVKLLRVGMHKDRVVPARTLETMDVERG